MLFKSGMDDFIFIVFIFTCSFHLKKKRGGELDGKGTR